MSHKHLSAPDDVVVLVKKGTDDDPGPPGLGGDFLQVLCDDELGCWVWKKIAVNVDMSGLRTRIKRHEEKTYVGGEGRRGGRMKRKVEGWRRFNREIKNMMVDL